MISAVDLLKGIAVGADMHTIHVEGANGGLHTNYAGKMQAALDTLLKDGYDFTYIHVEAPDEMGHQGLVKEKIQAIENIDKYIVGPLVRGLDEAKEEYRILVLPDHPTPIRARTHTRDAVPYLLYDSRKTLGECASYCEKAGKNSGIFCEKGFQLIDTLLNE
jgi:2,3-bisphosphoglycerate-independent phosphoglycerate mutase